MEKLGATCLFAPFFGLLLHAKPWADQEDVVIIGYTNSIRCGFYESRKASCERMKRQHIQLHPAL